MLEKILGVSINTTLGDLGALAALTSIIVQVLKKIIPSKFPTQALVIIVALFITTLASVMTYGIMLKTFAIGIISGFVVAFIAMQGFDSLKSIWNKFTLMNVNEETIEETSYNVSDEFDDEPDWEDDGGDE